MSGRRRRVDEARLAQAAARYQEEHIIPHCPSCSRPCCKLDELVLELSWPQVNGLYQIGGTKQAFDRALVDDDDAPQSKRYERLKRVIKEHAGTYYAHGEPCPAYRPSQGCAVYGTTQKPAGCSDFPVYADAGALVADRRCEAVDLDVLAAHLRGALGDVEVQQLPDEQFPQLVTVEVFR